MWVLAQTRCRLGDTHLFEQLDGPRLPFLAPEPGGVRDGRPQLTADRQHRVQRGERVLKDGADPATAKTLELAVAEPDQLLPSQLDRPALDPAGRVEQLQDGAGDRRLPSTRLADNADDLAALDRERHVLDRGETRRYGSGKRR